MLWRRADLERAGGIEALGKEVAEDAAATKIVRDAGLKVRLVDRPLAQPLGRRSAAEVWNRQLRWARLRRASFLLYFLPEILSGGVLPMIAIAFLAHALWRLPLRFQRRGFGALWYGGEMAACRAPPAGISRALYPLYGLMRDLLLPVLFVNALRGNDFVWRGNEMQVERMQAAPHDGAGAAARAGSRRRKPQAAALAARTLVGALEDLIRRSLRAGAVGDRIERRRDRPENPPRSRPPPPRASPRPSAGPAATPRRMKSAAFSGNTGAVQRCGRRRQRAPGRRPPHRRPNATRPRARRSAKDCGPR